MTKSKQFEWSYLQRVLSDREQPLEDMEDELATLFLFAIFGGNITPDERYLFLLQARVGALDMLSPTNS